VSAVADQHRGLRILYALAVANGTLLGVRQLVLPLYADSLGASHATIGLLFGAYMLGSALICLPAGALLARWGSRKILVASFALAVAAQVATGLTGTVPVLFGAQFVGGLAQGTIQTALLASAIRIAPRNRMGSAVGWIGLLSQVGWGSAAPVAGALLNWVSLSADFVVMSIPIAGAGVLAYVGVRSAETPLRARFEIRRPMALLSRQPGLAGVLLLMLGSTLGWGAYQAYFPLFANRELGLTATEVSILLALQAVANGGSRIAGRLYDGVRRKGLLVGILLFGFAAGLELIAHVSGFWLTAGLVLVAVGCLGSTLVGVTMLFAEIAPEEARSQAFGLFTTLQFLGIAASPAIIAPVMNYNLGFGFEVLGVVVAGIVIAALTVRWREVNAPLVLRREGHSALEGSFREPQGGVGGHLK
jgi:MFS family permease